MAHTEGKGSVTAPERIYLHDDGSGWLPHRVSAFGGTYPLDTEYLRADVAEAMIARYREALAELVRLKDLRYSVQTSRLYDNPDRALQQVTQMDVAAWEAARALLSEDGK